MFRVSLVVIVGLLSVLFLIGCSFSEFAQTSDLENNIDSYRTGCLIDEADILVAYKEYESKQYDFTSSLGPLLPDFILPTPTPFPVTNEEFGQAMMLKQVWQSGCDAGRRDVVGAEQISLLQLKDMLKVLENRIIEIEDAALVPDFSSTTIN